MLSGVDGDEYPRALVADLLGHLAALVRFGARAYHFCARACYAQGEEPLMRRLATLVAAVLGFSSPAHATEIFDAEGAWVGSGILPTGVDAPLQRGRCLINVSPKPNGKDVSVTGSCFVGVGVSDISLRVVRSGNGRVNAGFWVGATGQTVQYSGAESATAINMLSTTDLILENEPYESHIRVSAPDADSFSIRVLLRAEGAEAWRMFADMTYHKSDN